MPGLYIVIEGHDGAGKSTIIKELDVRLKAEGYPVISTFMPGATKLGAHIRKLVKYPSSIDPDIEIDEMTRQLLYLADASNFIKMILEPSLSDNKIVISDRSSFISTLIYGKASKIDVWRLSDIYSLLKPPQIDKLFVLSTPLDVAIDRVESKLANESIKDHFDNMPFAYHEEIHKLYRLEDPVLTTIISRFVSLQNIAKIDTDRKINDISNQMFTEIVRIYEEKKLSSQ